MNKIKIIDLLNKIANGEEVKYVLKGRSAIDDNMSLTDALIDWLSINYEETEDDVSWLNDEVEILDEEDEFEDIEEFKEHKLINTIDILEFEMIINKINADYNYKINQLIKNQKKIIERLKNES